MTYPLFNRPLAIATLVATLTLAANGMAQEGAPTPSPSPAVAASPVVEGEPVQVDAAQIEADVERSENQRRRTLEILKGVTADRKTLERGARNAAKQMA